MIITPDEAASLDTMSDREFTAWNRQRRAALGPLVPKGGGYQEIIAAPPHPANQIAFKDIARRRQEDSRYLMMIREDEIEAGLVHQTPAMEESERKLREREQAGDQSA